nr:hypothetical protein [Mailhella massiliensis]
MIVESMGFSLFLRHAVGKKPAKALKKGKQEKQRDSHIHPPQGDIERQKGLLHFHHFQEELNAENNAHEAVYGHAGVTYEHKCLTRSALCHGKEKVHTQMRAVFHGKSRTAIGQPHEEITGYLLGPWF